VSPPPHRPQRRPGPARPPARPPTRAPTLRSANFSFFSSRPSIDAFGFPMWGYDSTFQKAGWHVEFEENEFGGVVDELYPPYGHPADGGVPSRWDARRDPFHTLGEEAKVNPTQLDVGDRMPLADDNWERAHQSKMKGVEGSWGDRMSFLRAHHLVPDKYRHAIVAARNAETSHFTNGEI